MAKKKKCEKCPLPSQGEDGNEGSDRCRECGPDEEEIKVPVLIRKDRAGETPLLGILLPETGEVFWADQPMIGQNFINNDDLRRGEIVTFGLRRPMHRIYRVYPRWIRTKKGFSRQAVLSRKTQKARG